MSYDEYSDDLLQAASELETQRALKRKALRLPGWLTKGKQELIGVV